MSLIIDAHEDLAFNALCFGRDYTRPVRDTWQQEKGSLIARFAGDTVIGWPEMQAGQVAVVFGTLFLIPERYKLKEMELNQVYKDCSQACRLYHQQIDYYHQLSDRHSDKFRLIEKKDDLANHLAEWQKHEASYPKLTHPTGIVLLMEGAEGLCEVRNLEEWWDGGVRIVGPVWAGTRFCGGSSEGESFTTEGYELLDAMSEMGFTLDISHMNEKSALQALDRYEGQVIASHANSRTLLKNCGGERHFTDQVIRRLFERNGTIGVVFYNQFLKAGWGPVDKKSDVSLDRVVAQIDYMCQLCGNAQQVGLGSDFDGGFGWQAVPYEIDSIADLQKLVPLMHERGYTEEDIASIFGLNWQRFLETTLP